MPLTLKKGEQRTKKLFNDYIASHAFYIAVIWTRQYSNIALAQRQRKKTYSTGYNGRYIFSVGHQHERHILFSARKSVKIFRFFFYPSVF